MTIFPKISKKFSLKKKCCLRSFCLLISTVFLCLFCGCKNELDYFAYVSELRSNILLAEADGFLLRVHAVEKELPYLSDGIPQERSTRTEIYLVAPAGDKTCNVAFSCGKREYGGEMSFDNVKTEYYFSCSLDISAERELPVRIEYGETVLELVAHSVKTENTITPQAALHTLQKAESELFASMTDKYGFSGEIYLRLIYEDSPYYYVGVINRNGEVNAFLLNAETGKILAKRKI